MGWLWWLSSCIPGSVTRSMLQSNPVGYWRLNDPAGSNFVRNYGSAGLACDARFVDKGGLALGATCGLANDSSRFPFSKCVQRERGETVPSFPVLSSPLPPLVLHSLLRAPLRLPLAYLRLFHCSSASLSSSPSSTSSSSSSSSSLMFLTLR